MTAALELAYLGFEVSDLPGWDALLTGVHDTSSSHFALLQAFAPLPLLRAAWAEAEGHGYLGHEFGDSALIVTSRTSARDQWPRAA